MNYSCGCLIVRKEYWAASRECVLSVRWEGSRSGLATKISAADASGRAVGAGVLHVLTSPLPATSLLPSIPLSMAKQAIKTCRRRPRRQRPNRPAAAACCHREPPAQWGRNLASMAAQILARFSEKRFSLCCCGGGGGGDHCRGHQRRRGVSDKRAVAMNRMDWTRTSAYFHGQTAASWASVVAAVRKH